MKTALYEEIKSRNGPSLFAAPLAWAVADFTRSLIGDEGGIAPDRTAMIVVSDQCSLSTIGELSRTAARGMISPLRFAGASPSIVAGLPALEQGIRGPTLCLTMPPQGAPDAILALIDCWIRDSGILAVVVVAHHSRGADGDLLKGSIAKSAGEETRRQVLQLCDPRTTATS